MAEARWFRRAGPGVVAIGAVLLVASTTTGAHAPRWLPAMCAGPARTGPGPIGAWYRLDPTLVGGVRTGQRLSIGMAGDASLRGLDLDAESFASGPFSGTVLLGTDDGTSSRLSLIDVGAGCAWRIARSDDVIRRATITPDGGTLVEFRVDRRSRADLGVWRRPLARPGPEVRLLPPIDPDIRFGPTWLTEFSWSHDGGLLAVQSCGEVACRVRWVDLATGVIGIVADPSVGDMVGLTHRLLAAHGACRGLPCPIRSVDLGTGSTRTLVPSAGQAIVVGDGGTARVVYELDTDGGTLGSIGIDGGDTRRLPVERAPQRLIAGPAWAGGAAELPPGWVAFGPDGRLPLSGPVGVVLRRVADGRSAAFEEVSR
jgi:hypothetical protein